MLVKITSHCTMGCTHCMEDAGPGGEHMTLETFERVIDFIDRNEFLFAMLTGGEPTDHPQFVDFVHLAKRKLKVLVMSNGLFWSDPIRRQQYMDLGIDFQIINDPRYYPQRVEPIKHPRVLYDDKLIAPITPLGRAKDMESGRKAPLCFNLRSAVRSFRDFRNAVMFMRQNAKMCTPSILTDGSIVAGESRFCYKIGTVENSNLELTNNLAQMKCNQCGLADNLSTELRTVIGE